MTHIKDAKPEKLRAAVAFRPFPKMRDDEQTVVNGRQARMINDQIEGLATERDASRAETEAVRSLAAELVEGLNIARRRFELLAVYDDTPRNGVRPSVGAAEAETLIAKARAAGIGAPAPKGERLEITVETPAETARSYDGIRRALGLEPAPKGEKGEPNG